MNARIIAIALPAQRRQGLSSRCQTRVEEKSGTYSAIACLALSAFTASWFAAHLVSAWGQM